MSVNEAAPKGTIDGLQAQLGLSLGESARLLRAFRDAGLDLAAGEVVCRTPDRPGPRRPAARRSRRRSDRALSEALRQEQGARAAVIVARAAEAAGVGRGGGAGGPRRPAGRLSLARGLEARATAGGGGVAVAHGGDGDIVLRYGLSVSLEAFEAFAREHDIRKSALDGFFRMLECLTDPL